MVELQEVNDEMADKLKAIQVEHQQEADKAEIKQEESTTPSSIPTEAITPSAPQQHGPARPPPGGADLSGMVASAAAAMPQKAETRTIEEVADELKRSPFFMTELEENDETEAFKALAYEGTPLENALEFKQQGNDQFKIKRWADAKEFYTKGVLILAAEERKRKKGEWKLSDDERTQGKEEKMGETDEEITAVLIPKQKALLEQLYGNRAACHLELKNYRSCWLDGSAALRLNDKNVKAYYRSAKAFLAVDRIAEADDACARGLELDENNASLKSIAKDIIKRNEQITAKARKEAEREAREKRRAMLLKAALKARNIPTRETEQPPEMEDAKVELVPDPDDPRSSLAFPTVLLYPNDLQSDFIKAFNEQQSVGDHLEYIFPLPWDEKNRYTAAGVECYMETTAGGLIKVGKKLPLLKILSSGKVTVVDDVVRIFAVPKGEANAWVAEFKSKKAAEKGSA